MTTTEFKKKMNVLMEKAECETILHEAFVYDEDQMGKIYISPEGEIFVADKRYKWVKIKYTLDDVETMRFDKYLYDDGELEESYIYIMLSNGDIVHLYVDHGYCNAKLTLIINKDNSREFRKELFESDFNILNP